MTPAPQFDPRRDPRKGDRVQRSLVGLVLERTVTAPAWVRAAAAAEVLEGAK